MRTHLRTIIFLAIFGTIFACGFTCHKTAPTGPASNVAPGQTGTSPAKTPSSAPPASAATVTPAKAPAGAISVFECGQDSASLGNHPVIQTANSPESWQTLYLVLHSNRSPIPSAPAVDMNKYNMLLLYVGQMNSPAYSLEIGNTLMEGATAVIKAKLNVKPELVRTTKWTFPYCLLQFDKTKVKAVKLDSEINFPIITLHFSAVAKADSGKNNFMLTDQTGAPVAPPGGPSPGTDQAQPANNASAAKGDGASPETYRPPQPNPPPEDETEAPSFFEDEPSGNEEPAAPNENDFPTGEDGAYGNQPILPQENPNDTTPSYGN